MIEALGYKTIFFGLFAGFIAIRGIFGLIAKRSGLSSSFESDYSAGQKGNKSSPISLIAA